MRYNRLGRTGLFVSEFCLGTMTFGQPKGRYAAAGGSDLATTERILARAIEAGINFIDTADVYSAGESEEMVGAAIRSLGLARKDVVLGTKFEHPMGAGPNDAGGSRVHVVRSVEASLKRLGTDYIDLYQMHGWDPATPVEETVRALDDLVRRGLIRYVGVSNWAAWQVATALGSADRLGASRFQSYQGYYSLAGREIEREVAPMLEAHGLGLIVYSPLAGGYLTGKYRDGATRGRRASIPFPPVDENRGSRVLAAMDGIAARHGVAHEAVALAWLRQCRVVTSIVLGVRSVEQLDANLKAGGVVLSDDDMRVLNEAGALTTEYPGWMMAQSEARAALLRTGVLAPAE